MNFNQCYYLKWKAMCWTLDIFDFKNNNVQYIDSPFNEKLYYYILSFLGLGNYKLGQKLFKFAQNLLKFIQKCTSFLKNAQNCQKKNQICSKMLIFAQNCS